MSNITGTLVLAVYVSFSVVSFMWLYFCTHFFNSFSFTYNLQGHLDVELNDAGRQQATAVSYHLYASFLGSAVKTKIIGMSLVALALQLNLLFPKGG